VSQWFTSPSVRNWQAIEVAGLLQLARKLRCLTKQCGEEAMLGLPSIAMAGFALAALVTRHWRYKIHRAARRNAISPSHVHLALDPVRWGDHGEGARSKNRPQSALRKTANDNRFWERMAGDSLEGEDQSEVEFVSINCELLDSSIRAAQRRQAFKVISNA
jgi:hypothetical protein